MSVQELEARVQALEREVAELRSRLPSAGPQPDWRRTIGLFRGDAVLHEVVEAGKAIRRSEQPDE